MPVAPADLLAPKGPVTTTLFPGEGVPELTVRLQQYIDNGEADSRVAAMPADQQDALVRNYALYQVFRDVHIRMTAEPLTVSVTDKGGHGYSTEQIKSMKELRDRFLGDFEAGLVVEEAAPAPPPSFPGSISVPTNVRW